MPEPTLNYVSCPDAAGSHRMAYWEWGAPEAAHVIVCVHGLARQGRDFDVLAQALVERAAGQLRVVCPDVVGRGKSDWLADPMAYQVPTYVADMLALLAQLNAQFRIETLDWVGTSMGGLVGMGLAGTPNLPLPAPVRRMVLNDVGPVVEWKSIQRIQGYIGQTGRFETVQQAADAMWAISRTFGPHTPEQWLALSRPMVKPLPDGALTLHYDPKIGESVRAVTPEAAEQGTAALWQAYDNIQARVLVTRGAESDLLSKDTAIAMTQRGPRASLVEFPGVGHAPTFVQDNQVEAVALFLLD
jgi:pimeloyl-ACP methyl ester carboxylesterase